MKSDSELDDIIGTILFAVALVGGTIALLWFEVMK